MSSSGTSPGSTPKSGMRAGLVMLLLTMGLLIGSGVARAVPPYRIPDQITDQNNSLGGNTAEVQNAIDKLYGEDKIQLWVVYVDSFDGESGDQWAAQSVACRGSARTPSCSRSRPRTGPTGSTAPTGSVLSTRVS